MKRWRVMTTNKTTRHQTSLRRRGSLCCCSKEYEKTGLSAWQRCDTATDPIEVGTEVTVEPGINLNANIV
eukprot:scaffold4510_cov183-Amphora_coffeaeformis.AAC.70